MDKLCVFHLLMCVLLDVPPNELSSQNSKMTLMHLLLQLSFNEVMKMMSHEKNETTQNLQNEEFNFLQNIAIMQFGQKLFIFSSICYLLIIRDTLALEATYYSESFQ